MNEGVALRAMMGPRCDIDVVIRQGVVVVGNGPSLAGQGLGKAIDAFPAVVRFNCWHADEDAGHRCTLWVKNLILAEAKSYVSTVPDSYRPEAAFIICPGSRGFKPARIHALGKEIQRRFPKVPLEFWGRGPALRAARSAGVVRPTTGLIVLHRLVSMGVVPSICGFDILLQEACKATHYWGGNCSLNAVHDPPKEGAWLRRQLDSGRVRLLGKEPTDDSRPQHDAVRECLSPSLY